MIIKIKNYLNKKSIAQKVKIGFGSLIIGMILIGLVSFIGMFTFKNALSSLLNNTMSKVVFTKNITNIIYEINSHFNELVYVDSVEVANKIEDNFAKSLFRLNENLNRFRGVEPESDIVDLGAGLNDSFEKFIAVKIKRINLEDDIKDSINSTNEMIDRYIESIKNIIDNNELNIYIRSKEIKAARTDAGEQTDTEEQIDRLVKEDYTLIRSLLDIKNEFINLSLIISSIDKIKYEAYLKPQKEKMIASFGTLDSKFSDVRYLLKQEDKKSFEEIKDTLYSLKKDLAGKGGIIAKQQLSSQALVEYEAELEKANKMISSVINKITELASASEQEAENIENMTMTSLTIIIFVVLFILLFSVITGFFMSNFLSGSIINPLSKAVGVANQMAEGRLTMDVKVDTGDETGQLLTSMKNMVVRLKEILGMVTDATINVNTSVSEISGAVKDQAAIVHEQYASLSEITATMDELFMNSKQIANNSQSVAHISGNALKHTETGANAVEINKDKMLEIKADNEKSLAEIIDLGKKSKEITTVMEFIKNIAEQTKLIAFNAAIEASSAGESGKRFNVVAGEIKELANSVTGSAKEIENKINEIHEAINNLVIASEKRSKRIDEGIVASSQTVEMLKDMVDGAKSTSDAAKQISVSTQQQETASVQVVDALKEIQKGSEQTSASISNITDISKNLKHMSDDLKKLVEQFELEDA
ncbi:MAG: methyl-accepting chemotaxis protein [Desulfobacterales bacterium]|nr:methyl-accepting chemotaxis protein [Desulfobacterales bacterium]